MFMQNVRMQYYKTRSLASLASKKKTTESILVENTTTQ